MYEQDAWLAVGIESVETLMKNPAGADATGAELVPDPAALSWQSVPFRRDPVDCDHIESMCASWRCVNSWQTDWWVRTTSRTEVRVLNEDYPGA